jgi:hypothetical protein
MENRSCFAKWCAAFAMNLPIREQIFANWSMKGRGMKREGSRTRWKELHELSKRPELGDAAFAVENALRSGDLPNAETLIKSMEKVLAPAMQVTNNPVCGYFVLQAKHTAIGLLPDRVHEGRMFALDFNTRGNHPVDVKLRRFQPSRVFLFGHRELAGAQVDVLRNPSARKIVRQTTDFSHSLLMMASVDELPREDHKRFAKEHRQQSEKLLQSPVSA